MAIFNSYVKLPEGKGGSWSYDLFVAATYVAIMDGQKERKTTGVNHTHVSTTCKRVASAW